MKPCCYTNADLHVTSELPLPEWAAFESDRPCPQPDVTITVESGERLSRPDEESGEGGPPPLEGEGVESEKFETRLITGDEYRFHAPHAGEYWVRQGRAIHITPAPGARPREMRLFLLGSAWGALCYQRGILSLHSSVVQVGNGAFAFCGETGAGKSLLAAWLISRGHRLVSDDLSRFEVLPNGAPRVYPSSPRLKLWRDALNKLGRSAAGLERDYFRSDKFHLPLPGDEAQHPLPLAGIYLLKWGEPGITRLTGATALRRFVESATYRGDLLEPMGQAAAHWQRCAEIARRVPIWEFARPRDWTAFDAAMEKLLKHWQNVY